MRPTHPRTVRSASRKVAATAILSALGLVAMQTAAAAAEPGAGTAAVADFATSFEAGQPALDWSSTVETGPEGPLAAGVTGPRPLGIPGDITGTVTKVSASSGNPPNEVEQNLADGASASKWLTFARTGWVVYELAEPAAVVRYALTSANDFPGRDPRAWSLQGSQDGTSWTPIDSRTDQQFPDRFQQRQFTADNTAAYRFYRLEVTQNHGEDIVQLADWLISESNTPTPPPPTMTTEVGSGPSAGYTSRAKVGWTGVRSLHYAGHHVPDGPAHSYAKVLDVDVPVEADTRLSYKIFPELSGSDLRNPSTYVAVDLAFTDGTYLRDLGAEDVDGKPLSPRGQGESKILYPNQWNSEESVIGAVAAGKTIDRVLVGYDNPVGPADFAGWIDDIEITSEPEQVPSARPSEHVLTTRGTNANGAFSRGNTFPATAVPHGFNFWTPVTNAGSASWLYEYQRGNDEQNRSSLQAFSLSHQPSPWMGDRQTFQVMPSSRAGTPEIARAARALTFSHDNETAQAHYYGVTFDNGLKTEMTPTDHAAMLRFTFPGDDASLVFDNINNAGGLTIDQAAGTISGYTDVLSGSNSVGTTRMFVFASFDRPITASGPLDGGGRPAVGGYARFDAGSERVVEMRIATSLISLEQAKHNLALEIAPTDSFDSVKDRAQAAWDEVLGVIEVEGASADQLTTLYSNLYRLNLYPNSGYENTGTADAPVYEHVVQSSTSSDPAPAGTTATSTGAPVKAGKVYVNNGFWDTYRTSWPAYSLLYPAKAGEMVNGFVQQYEDAGWISRWSSPGYADIMTGTSSDVAFADAALKGVPGIDLDDMYDAAVKNATVAPPDRNVGRKGLDQGIFLGHTPSSTGESVSWALEGYINDHGIANLAKALHESTDTSDPRHQEYLEDYHYFRDRSLGYANIFNPESGFFQGRDAFGGWRSPAASFDPTAWWGDYTETNAWNFAFHAVQDGQGLANLFGGKAGLGDKLDEFFATPELGKGSIHEMLEARDVRFGQWGLSNQVSHHVPYMYAYAGEPAKGAAVIREALSRSFTGSDIGQGYPGDEDNGEMSAWQIFSSLGFYPVQVGSPEYVIGSPLYDRATIHLENGKDLVIDAPGNSPANVYVQGMRVDGVAHTSTSISHAELADGGTIEFDLGPTPSAWGTGADDAPSSITEDGERPEPQRDVTGRAKGIPAGSTDRARLSQLFDNTSATRVTLPGTAPRVDYALTGTTARVQRYTLTSGAVDADPTGWVLKGSNDATTWTTLDTRTAQTFPWRLQTRAFTIADPQVYRHYRLEITGSTGGDSTSLAEIELLADRPQVGELEEVVDEASGAGSLAASTARDLRTTIAAAQQAEDSGDGAGVLVKVRALQAELDVLTGSRVGDAARASIRLVASQWLAPGRGLEQVREQVGVLSRSGDVAASTAADLFATTDAAQRAHDAGDSAQTGTQVAKLHEQVSRARTAKVSQRAKDVLLPLITPLLQPSGSAGAWIGTWMTAPSGPSDNGCRDCTLRNIVHTSVGGSSMRVRLSNAFGSAALTVADTTAALPAAPGSAEVAPGTLRHVTFGGSRSVVIPKGEEVWSDPVPLVVPGDSDLLVTTYTPGYATPMTYHPDAKQTSFFTRGANKADATSASEFPETMTSWHFLTGVDVGGSTATGAVVALGDSITDGSSSTHGANRRWPNFLANRLRTERGDQLGVLDAGIGGNRVLLDGGAGFGPAALDRLDRDVLRQSGVRDVVFLLGINDIQLTPHQLDPTKIIAGLQEMADRSHAAGLRVVGGTITPFKGWYTYNAEQEATREAVNTWIRTSGVFDAVIDFDAMVRDPEDVHRILSAYDSGDNLHPSDLGLAAMADAVDLAGL